MNRIDTQTTADQTLEPLIRLENIGKTYGGEVPIEVLKGVSLDIHPGEFVAIMGASGSGKSTLMNILGLLDQPTRGRYVFNGRDVSHLDRDELARLRREEFGFVFQSYHLIAGATALENVEVPAIYSGQPPADRHERAGDLLGALGLSERLNHRPNQLSGGQQQRVSIARALMNGGRIILADEPTGALDTKSGADVMALLGDLAARGHTVILITHDPKVAEHADRVIQFQDGRVLSDSGVSLRRGIPTLPASAAAGSASAAQDVVEAGKMALRALRSNLFRTLLTLLGVMIGVASVVAVLGVGEGAKAQVLERIGSMGSNLLVVRPGAPNQRFSAGGQVTSLVPEDADAVAQLPNVTAAVPERQGAVTARIGNRDYATQATATSTDMPEIRSWPVSRGVFFSAEDVDRYATVAVLGETVARALFPDGEDPVGGFVVLNNVPFQIIGVMAPKGATGFGQDQDDVVFVPITTGGLRLFGQTHVRSVTVAVADVAQMSETETAVRNLLTERHGREDFQIRNMAELAETISSTANTLTILLGSIAAISLLVGGIGVMNIMLMSVTERTREIGIRMATGATTRNILQQFITEAMVVSAIGGLLGIGLGVAAGYAIAQTGLPLAFTAQPMLLAFGCAVATGLIFGFAPALKASRLNPVVALSSE